MSQFFFSFYIHKNTIIQILAILRINNQQNLFYRFVLSCEFHQDFFSFDMKSLKTGLKTILGKAKTFWFGKFGFKHRMSKSRPRSKDIYFLSKA